MYLILKTLFPRHSCSLICYASTCIQPYEYNKNKKKTSACSRMCVVLIVNIYYDPRTYAVPRAYPLL